MVKRIIFKTIVNPEKEKFSLHDGRYRTTRDILNRRWQKSQLVWAYYNHITLEMMNYLLSWGFCIHHKDGNIQNDSIENLELILQKTHAYNHKKGGKLSLKTRQKISQTRKGKYCGKDNPFYGKKHTLETRKKISEALKREKNPWYGKPLPPETRKKISDAQKGEKNHMWGRKHTLETRQKMSEARKGENNANYRHNISNNQIIDLFKQGKNVCQIARELSTNHTLICRRLKKLGYNYCKRRKNKI